MIANRNERNDSCLILVKSDICVQKHEVTSNIEYPLNLKIQPKKKMTSYKTEQSKDNNISFSHCLKVLIYSCSQNCWNTYRNLLRTYRVLYETQRWISTQLLSP